MTMTWSRSIVAFILPLLAMVFLPSCSSAKNTSTPAVPVDWVTELGGVVFVSLPIPVHHARFQLAYYDESGERRWAISDVELFPTDVFVVYDSDHQTARVFLARSPHMGCLLKWSGEAGRFEDPCTGSHFSMDGSYESGPAPRSLDELPVEVRDQMIWVRNELVYGQGHP